MDKQEIFFLEIDKEKVLDFQTIFGNSQPLHIEIGSGRGEFLAKKAQQEPDINFLGIELQMKRIRQILLKLDPKLHQNVRIANLYIDSNISKIIPPNSIDSIYIQHPDPWPKKRHFKNRLIQNDFINSLAKILKKDCLVKIATDHKEYSEWIIEHFANNDKFEAVFENGFTMQPYSGHIDTYFENKKRSEGFPPIFMHYKKV